MYTYITTVKDQNGKVVAREKDFSGYSASETALIFMKQYPAKKGFTIEYVVK
jgi:hypothetical protein